MNDERDVYTRQGFGRRLGVGRSMGLLIVDFVAGFKNPAVFGGGNIPAAIERTVGLLDACRAASLPIINTRVVFERDGSDKNVFIEKVPSLARLTELVPESQIVPELAPIAGDFVLRKRLPSAFFGTNLAAWYTAKRVDTLLIAGCTTSGCVRASAVDAICSGFRPIVVTDCVGDRALDPHEANLFDLGQKTADLMTRDEVLEVMPPRTHAARHAPPGHA